MGAELSSEFIMIIFFGAVVLVAVAGWLFAGWKWDRENGKK